MIELADRLSGQYLLVPRGNAVTLPGWRAISKGDWDLYTKAPLPVRDIIDNNGQAIGWLLGHAIHDADGVVAHTLRLPIDSQSATKPGVNSLVEQWSGSAGGRYLAIMLGSEARIYPDAGAFLPAYRCSRSGAVASSPQLAEMVAGYAGPDAMHDEMRQAINASRKTSWFPFGLTPCPTVIRLLPNHHLNLHTGETTRYWRPTLRYADFGKAIEAIAATLRTQTQHLLAYSSCYVSLTAGYDSRLVLAACLGNRSRITCYTVDSNQVDVCTARQLAKLIRAKHVVINRLPPRPGDREVWLQRTGHCIVNAATGSMRRRPSLDTAKAVLGGFGGEVCRGFYWRRVSSLEAPLSAEDLIAALHLPTSNLLRQAADAWLGDASYGLSTRDVLDLAYIEQRLGCWAAPQQLAEPSAQGGFHPLVHHRIFESMFGIGHEFRGGRDVAVAAIGQLWPELLQIPFNHQPCVPVRSTGSRVLERLVSSVRTPIQRGWRFLKSLR